MFLNKLGRALEDELEFSEACWYVWTQTDSKLTLPEGDSYPHFPGHILPVGMQGKYPQIWLLKKS